MYYLYLWVKSYQKLGDTKYFTHEDRACGYIPGPITSIIQVVSREAKVLSKSSVSFHHIIPPLFWERSLTPRVSVSLSTNEKEE